MILWKTPVKSTVTLKKILRCTPNMVNDKNGSLTPEITSWHCFKPHETADNILYHVILNNTQVCLISTPVSLNSTLVSLTSTQVSLNSILVSLH